MTEYRLVPVEPTEEMVAAIAHADWTSKSDLSWADGWRIMLSAAPPAPTREEVARVIRQCIKVDATGLAPAVAGSYVLGFEEAADAILSLLGRPE